MTENNFDRVYNPNVPGDLFRTVFTENMATNSIDVQAQFTRAILEAEDDLLVKYLQCRGYVVARPADGAQLSGHAVAKFRDAWNAADRAGRAGNRVRAGLEAARPFLNLEAVVKIDETRDVIDNMQGRWGASDVRLLLGEIRDLIAPNIPRFSVKLDPGSVAVPEVDKGRWRCLIAGCNPKLIGEAAADAHREATGHRVAKWPVRSAEGKRRERKRNRTGYHRRYQGGSDWGRGASPEYGDDHPGSEDALGQS